MENTEDKNSKPTKDGEKKSSRNHGTNIRGTEHELICKKAKTVTQEGFGERLRHQMR